MKKRELQALNKGKKGEKHHYIPQFYLRPWLGVDHKLEEFGHVPPSGQIRSRRRGTESTGFEYDLYSIPGATQETRNNIERLFMGPVDKTAAAARDTLLSGIIPTGSEKIAWARFLLSLAMRTPEALRSFKKAFIAEWMIPDPELQQRYEAERKPDWPATLEDYYLTIEPSVAERQALRVATQLMQRENILQLFSTAKWWTLDTSSVKRPLMTSDHPLVMTNGLGRPDGHFGIPIGPRMLFVAFMEEEFARKFQRMPVGKIVRLTNEAVIGQGRKYVYGLDASNIAEVRRLMGRRDYVNFLLSSE